jgi:hypothetical protein
MAVFCWQSINFVKFKVRLLQFSKFVEFISIHYQGKKISWTTSETALYAFMTCTRRSFMLRSLQKVYVSLFSFPVFKCSSILFAEALEVCVCVEGGGSRACVLNFVHIWKKKRRMVKSVCQDEAMIRTHVFDWFRRVDLWMKVTSILKSFLEQMWWSDSKSTLFVDSR